LVEGCADALMLAALRYGMVAISGPKPALPRRLP
jgi:hypothetical protein